MIGERGSKKRAARAIARDCTRTQLHHSASHTAQPHRQRNLTRTWYRLHKLRRYLLKQLKKQQECLFEVFASANTLDSMHFTLDQLHFTIRQLTADVHKVDLQLRRLSDESVSHLVGAKPCAKPAMGSTPAAPALSHRLPTSIAASKDDTECMGMDIILSPVAHKAAPPAGQAAGKGGVAEEEARTRTGPGRRIEWAEGSAHPHGAQGAARPAERRLPTPRVLELPRMGRELPSPPRKLRVPSGETPTLPAAVAEPPPPGEAPPTAQAQQAQ